MTIPAVLREDQLTRLVALSPGDERIAGLVRRVCAQAMSLPPLPSEVSVAEPATDAEATVAAFAEQFAVDVSSVTAEQRSQLFKALGDATLPTVALMYVADFVPRVRAGLEALGVGEQYMAWVDEPIVWDHESDPSDVLFNQFLPAVARMRALDPVLAEMVRLRGARQHNCRLCKSLRETTALESGGSESLYDEIEHYDSSAVLDGRAKAALKYVDGLIWTPAHLVADDVAEVRSWFSEAEAVELTFDVMRNASNKIAVSLGGDAARVQDGTEQYLLDADGQTVFS
jgi:alkylhydroperoxidase family enzyme